MDPKLKAQLEADAAKLEKSGFNLYEPTFASSGNGRAVIAMQDSAGTQPNSAEVKPSREARREETTVDIRKLARVEVQTQALLMRSVATVIRQLEEAMESCQLDALRNTINFARANVSNAESSALGPTLGRAVELATVLQESVTGDQLSSSDVNAAVQVVSSALLQIQSLAEVDKETAIGTLSVLKKLLSNFVTQPMEPKFQKVRLANKAIQAK